MKYLLLVLLAVCMNFGLNSSIFAAEDATPPAAESTCPADCKKECCVKADAAKACCKGDAAAKKCDAGDKKACCNKADANAKKCDAGCKKECCANADAAAAPKKACCAAKKDGADSIKAEDALTPVNVDEK